MENDFFEQVYQVVRLIPRGRVTSYGAIAKYLGASKSSRVVGYAMNAAHNQCFDSAQQPCFDSVVGELSRTTQQSSKIPAHRVVNRNGELTGKHHFATPFLMQELLEKENIIVKNDTIVNFKKHYWDPSIELEL